MNGKINPIRKSICVFAPFYGGHIIARGRAILQGEVVYVSKQSAYYKVPGLGDKHDVKDIKRALASIPGVISVSVSPRNECVAVDYDGTGVDSDVIQAHIRQTGWDAKLIENENHVM